jgi:hypothetical protein
MKLSDIKIDLGRLEGGDWIDNIPGMSELALRVRGIGNSEYRQLQAKLIDALPRQKRLAARTDVTIMEGVTTECLVETCLLDWRGLTDEADAELPYSKEMARELMTNPAYRAFRDAVTWAAGIVADQRVSDLETDEKN